MGLWNLVKGCYHQKDAKPKPSRTEHDGPQNLPTNKAQLYSPAQPRIVNNARGTFFNELRKKDVDCDLTITCAENAVVKCHKNILRFHCDHNQWRFMDTLNLDDIKSEIVTAIVEYFYLCRFEAPIEHIPDTIRVCDALAARVTSGKLRNYLLSSRRQFQHFTVDRQLFRFNHMTQRVEFVIEIPEILESVNIVIDMASKHWIGIDTDGTTVIHKEKYEKYNKKVWAFVNDDSDSVFLFTDNTVAGYSEGGFTDNIPDKYRLLRKIKYNSIHYKSVIELRIINDYLIVGRRPESLYFEYRLERQRGLLQFELTKNKWRAKFVSAKGSPFIVYTIGYTDRKPETCTHILNNDRYIPKQGTCKVSEREFPLRREFYSCVASYYSYTEMLAAVDSFDSCSFEFRLYNMDDHTFTTVSDKIPKRGYVLPENQDP